MQLYRHFKNLPYRYLDRVIHSETLETMVLYETLYDNPKGKLWVRPEANFFENIEAQGITKPRFAPMSLDLQSHRALTPESLSVMLAIAKACFSNWKAEVLLESWQSSKNLHIGLAYLDGKALGFSWGDGSTADLFHSLLVGVCPEFQAYGIASSLMEQQQAFCRQNGYKMIQTKALNRDRAALLLNTQHGFLVTATEPTTEGLQLVFEKALFDDILSC